MIQCVYEFNAITPRQLTKNVYYFSLLCVCRMRARSYFIIKLSISHMQGCCLVEYILPITRENVTFAALGFYYFRTQHELWTTTTLPWKQNNSLLSQKMLWWVFSQNLWQHRTIKCIVMKRAHLWFRNRETICIQIIIFSIRLLTNNLPRNANTAAPFAWVSFYCSSFIHDEKENVRH